MADDFVLVKRETVDELLALRKERDAAPHLRTLPATAAMELAELRQKWASVPTNDIITVAEHTLSCVDTLAADAAVRLLDWCAEANPPNVMPDAEEAAE